MADVHRMPYGTPVLQWGRGGEAAESELESPARRPDDSCFNGAAAVKPRNSGRGPARIAKEPRPA